MADAPHATMASGEFERRVQQVLEAPHKASVQEVLVLLREALAISSEVYSGRRWQPIETAPKDGTWILACVPSGSQYNRENNAGYSWLPEVIHWGVYHPNSRGKHEWRNGDGVRRPHHSHWMPLPEPPEVSRGL